MKGHVLSQAFVDDVERFGGGARLTAQLNIRTQENNKTDEHPRPPGGRTARKLWPRSGRIFSWLAGVDYDLVSRSYVDRARYTTLGFSVLLTGALAGLSFYLVLSSIGVSAFSSGLLAIPWTLVVITLHRSLVMSTSRRPQGSFKLIAVLPWLVIALLIAFTIAQPLTLRLFQHSIAAEIQATRVAEAQEFAARQYGDPRIQILEEQLAAAEAAVSAARIALDQERAGTGGTGVPGLGPSVDRLTDDLERALVLRDQAQAEYAAARAQIEISLHALDERSVGLLEQFEAFDRVSDNNSTVREYYLLIMLLVVVIEMLPVILVLLDPHRGRSLYESLLVVQERYVRSKFEVEVALGAGKRLVDADDPELDEALKNFERQRTELDQATQETMAKVVQLVERRKAG